ncbi:hypothetical protein V5O48_007217 [Marasmius crinis-equi]|uniref:Myb-like domain-containing protein n=1 Tax=Marasmius crinis-equi TaxID=585013 RepID=A0ABR3FHS7_9AGAR
MPRKKANTQGKQEEPHSESKTCKWLPKDEEQLLAGLIAKKAAAGDGTNFTMTTFNEVAQSLNPPEEGLPKTGKSCKNKYNTLKSIWDVIVKIHHQSGWPDFDEYLGANITENRETVWQEYEMAHPKAAPFKNKGWKYYQEFNQLLPLGSTLLNETKVTRISRKPQVDEEDSSSSSEESSSDVDEGCNLKTPATVTSTRRQSAKWDFKVLDDHMAAAHASQAREESPCISREASDVSIGSTLTQESSTGGQKRSATETPLPNRTPDKHSKSKPGTPSTPAPPRHRHLPTATDSRTVAATALSSMASGIGDFNKNIFGLLGGGRREVNDTPTRLAAAIELSKQEKAWLPVKLCLELQNVFARSKEAVVMYQSMDKDDKELRRTWILDQLGVPIPDDYDIMSDTVLPYTPSVPILQQVSPLFPFSQF